MWFLNGFTCAKAGRGDMKTYYGFGMLLLLLFCGSWATLSCVSYMNYYDMDESGREKFDEIRYVATDKELGEFSHLAPGQRDEWLEKFWKKRDPTPDTPVNEYKLEHYKRLRYAQKHFAWGKIAGHKTDRGMIFIKYGPPTQLDSKVLGDVSVMGGWYSKPFEEWWYDYIPYVGTDFKFRFVDQYMTGEYVLVTRYIESSNSPDQKREASRFEQASVDDVGSTGELNPADGYDPTQSRKDGDLSYRRSSRAGGGVWETRADGTTLSEDSIIDIEQGVIDPFKAAVPITPEEATIDLVVGVLTFASKGRTNMVEFDFVIPNTNLQFEPDEEEGSNDLKAEIVISTRLYDSERRLVGGTVRRRFAVEAYEEDTAAPDRFFVYIAGALLEPGVYEIEAVALDKGSEQYGYVRQTFEVKIIDPRRLSLSSVELASKLHEATDLTMFVKHGYEVTPNPAGVYRMGGILSVYYEIYNLEIAGDGNPKFMIEYSISRRESPDDRIFRYKFMAPREGGRDQVQVYNLALRPDIIETGEYTFHIRVIDVVEGVELLAHSDFEVVD